jgi:hypothetical protein
LYRIRAQVNVTTAPVHEFRRFEIYLLGHGSIAQFFFDFDDL